MRKRCVFIVGMMMLMVVCFSTVWAKVSVTILKDVYVLPVAELATTKTHPEVIKVENDVIEMTLVPNRGRILSSYLLKGDPSLSFLYQNFVPKPMVLPGGLHVVEFGGYYLSLPWNDRDRQPLDLSFALTHQEEGFAEAFLAGRDMFRKTLTECWVRIKEKSPVVEIEIVVTNLSKRETKTLPFKDFAVLGVSDDCFLALPVAAVKVMESRNDWFGEPGKMLNWSKDVTGWGNMKDYVRFTAEEDLALPCVALVYPEKSIAFVKWWEPRETFTGFEVWSWGQSWTDEPGADAYIVVSSFLKDLVLEPQEQVSFKIYFAALEGISQGIPLQELWDRSRSLLR